MSFLNTRSLFRGIPAVLAAAVAIAVTRPAEAILCSSLPNPVYLTGGGSKAVSYLAQPLAAGTNQATLIYKLQGSCLAVDAILAGTMIGLGALPADKMATYWDSAGTALTCDLDAKGNIADVGLSDVFPSTCQALPNGLPSNVKDFFGPAESYVFVVPKASKQMSISRDAGYFVFGFGSASGVVPWTDETLIFQRGAASGTQQMMGVALGVPPEKWKGTLASSSGDLQMKLSGAMNPDAAIGILTAEVAGANTPTLSVLAYQDDGQSCGYWPDSTATATDKQNVRDGHYPIWGPLHLLTQVNASGYPQNPAAADVIGYLTGTKAPPGGLDLIALLAKVSIIPTCAMHVQRSSELGALSSFQPDRSCSCYFDTLTNSTNATKCTKCTTDTECAKGTPRCNNGFCEAQ